MKVWNWCWICCVNAARFEKGSRKRFALNDKQKPATERSVVGFFAGVSRIRCLGTKAGSFIQSNRAENLRVGKSLCRRLYVWSTINKLILIDRTKFDTGRTSAEVVFEQSVKPIFSQLEIVVCKPLLTLDYGMVIRSICENIKLLPVLFRLIE